ncbi:phosphonate metabolism protein/1,5-bisphosphokinase (PRPP-forming) PhnN ['Osedax' symbiont bacterium Rs2_46_30_T18]|nr:phosphonate metabolism protein/1,5-bisphosphokinase (PRPP-forming) PhnN ['Osedax' symbiont bacterium Rs2_46_30_T18]
MSGKLFYIMGASGAGKDSVLNSARAALADTANCCIAHRYITRAADAGAENHLALSDAEFEFRKSNGLFKMHWAANGLQYGIGIEVDQWLAAGVNVLMNGSRAYLATAQDIDVSLVAIYIDVDSDCLRQRLMARGRESEAEIEQRLIRHAQLAKSLPGDVNRIDNSGDLNVACTQLMTLLTEF